MKRSTPLKRTKPLRRSKPEGPSYERERKPMALATVKPIRRGVYGGTTVAAPKTQPLQHAGYEAAVRALGYCMRCGRVCKPQFCHRDQGKGGGVKTDSREGWPGCDDCHALLGGHKGGGRMPKEERRALELELGRRTREAVKAAGLWPSRLATWEEQPEAERTAA